MFRSIRWRLAAGIVFAFVLTLAVIFATVQFTLTEILRDNLDDGLASDAGQIRAELSVLGSLVESNSARVQEIVRRYANATEDRTPFITVVRDTSGQALVWTERVQHDNLALTDEELQRVLSGTAVTRTIELPGPQEYRVRSEPLVIGGRLEGIVQVGRVTEGVVAPVNTLLVILVGEGIAAVIITVAIALWLSRGAVKPLQRVIDVAAEIEASDLTRRIKAQNEPYEVQKLADTFDAMIERLDKAFREQQNFVMDVSHELRTPLTVLKGNIEVMLMDPNLNVETRGQLERMAAEVSRLIRLTSNLLYIASADAGREPERRPVELDVVCLEVLRQGRELRQDVKLSLGHEDQVTVIGDRDQIKQMVLNLVENAVKYSNRGGQVTLSLYGDGPEVRIEVTDTGAGIPPDILPHIFERFYRGNQRSVMGGTGLGLAIADRIARSHGGRIEVQSKLGEGSTFTVYLPRDGREPEREGIAGVSQRERSRRSSPARSKAGQIPP